jgi:hypothetical protein
MELFNNSNGITPPEDIIDNFVGADLQHSILTEP